MAAERAAPRQATVRPPHPARQSRNQHDRVGLDPHGRTQREGRAAEPPGPPALGRVGRGDDARRAPHEETAEEELTLPSEPRTAGDVVEGEERRRGQAAPYPGGPQRAPETGPDEDEEAQIERAEREVPGSEGEEEQEVCRVYAGEVHVEEVAIGRGPVQDPPRDVVHERGVVNERPAPREPHEPERGQPHQSHGRRDHDAKPRSPDTGDGDSRGRRMGAPRGHRVGMRAIRPGRERSVAPQAVGVKRGGGQIASQFGWLIGPVPG